MVTAPSPDRGPHDPLIGRRLELSWLRTRLDLAGRGYPHLVLIEGEAGIGKTRLAHELLTEARRTGTTVVRGRCYEHLDLAYLPLRDSLFPAIAATIRGLPGRESDVELLERTGAAPPPDRPAPEEADTAERTRQLLDLTRLVIDFARSTAAVVFVDDLDWADGVTIDLLRHLLFRFDDEAVPLLLVATARGDPQARAATGVANLRTDGRTATLSLPALSELEATELAREHSTGATVEHARQLAIAGGGNPLLVEALARETSGSSFTPGTRGQTGHPMTRLIEARLDALRDPTRRVVRAAAVLVPNCTPSLLAAVSDLAPDVFGDALDDAYEQGILTEDEGAITFTHPLYQHLTHAQTPGPARRATHARAAALLLARLGDHGVGPRAIAHHLIGAGEDADRALVAEWARRAGDEAFALASWSEAARSYEAALEAIDQEADPRAAASVHRLAGLSLRGNLELARAVGHFDAAIACLGPDADPAALTDLHLWRIRCGIGALDLLDIVRDRQPLEALVSSIESTHPSLAADALVELSQSYWVDAAMDRSEEAARRAMALADTCGNDEAYARAAMSLSVPQWFRYDLQDSLASLQDGATRAARSDDRSTLAGGPSFRAPLVMAWLGHLDDAESQAIDCCERAERINYPLEEGLPLAALALVAVTRGEFDRAEHFAHKALLVQRLSGYHWAAGLFLPVLFAAGIARGRYETASDALDTWAETANDVERTTIALFRRYADALERGHPVEGDRLPPLPRTPMLGADAWAVAIVEIARREGRATGVARAHELLREMERRGGRVANGFGVLLPRARAAAADLLGNEEEAIATLQHAIALARTLRAEPEHARALVDLAMIRLRRGERDEGLDLVDDAIRRFDRLGMRPDAERAAELGGDPAARATGGGVEATTARSVIVFSDVVDSTRLTEELGNVRYRQRARRLEAVITSSYAAHGGRIVAGINLGDGFIGLFPTVGQAIAAARQCARDAGSTGLHVHLGVHVGEIIIEGPRIHGGAVNYAARLCSLTGPDEILVSEAVRDAAAAVAGAAFVDRGHHAMKGIAGRQRVYSLVAPETAAREIA